MPSAKTTFSTNTENITAFGTSFPTDVRDAALDSELAEKTAALENKERQIKEGRLSLENSAAKLEELLKSLGQSEQKLESVRSQIAVLGQSISETSIKSVTAMSSLSEIENRGSASRTGFRNGRRLFPRRSREKGAGLRP